MCSLCLRVKILIIKGQIESTGVCLKNLTTQRCLLGLDVDKFSSAKLSSITVFDGGFFSYNIKPIFHQKTHLRWLPNAREKYTNMMKSA